MMPLLYLNHGLNHSDEEFIERWLKSVLYQCFSSTAIYEPRLLCDATQRVNLGGLLTRASVGQLHKSTIEAAVSVAVVKKAKL